MKTIIQGIPMSHIALALGILVLIMVLPIFYSPKKFKSAMEDFLNSGNTALRMVALAELLAAFIILNTHWTIKLNSTRSIMTVIGYLLALRGVIQMWFPAFIRQKTIKWLQKDLYIYVMGVVGLLIGGGLIYLGNWVY